MKAKETAPTDMPDTNEAPNEELLDTIQKEAFDYFTHEANPENGLVKDKTGKDSPASIAAVGFALAAYPVGVERKFITREAAIDYTLTILRFFHNSEQSTDVKATGYKGFYYHFLDLKTGERTSRSELSTIDTTLFLAGALTGAAYFDRDNQDEREIRDLADSLFRRVDWNWALNGGKKVSHGWKPERGFLRYTWDGYSEALILYILGLGSPTHPLPRESYEAWTSTYKWKKIYGYEYLYAGPLFIHQFSHLWIDFRGIRDEFMREHECDYFENSRRATYVQQQYAIRDPMEFEGYSEHCWGITASDGPGPKTQKVNGIQRKFYDYTARGVPFGVDDGTIAPWVTVSSLPFAPEIVIPTIRNFNQLDIRGNNKYGYKATFNQTFPAKRKGRYGWVSPFHYGLNTGPIVLMIENYRTELIWKLMSNCPYMVEGLQKAGFKDIKEAKTNHN